MSGADGGEAGAREPQGALAHRRERRLDRRRDPVGAERVDRDELERPPVGPSWNDGVLLHACRLRRRGGAVDLRGDRAVPSASSRSFPPSRPGTSAAISLASGIAHPAGVLGALACIEAVHDVPEVVVPAGGDRGPERRVRVGPDEREPVEDDPQLARPTYVANSVGSASRAQRAQ